MTDYVVIERVIKRDKISDSILKRRSKAYDLAGRDVIWVINDCMLLLITISVLFIYTVVLIGFFMGWCTLIPMMFHPRKEIPFCAVKSPRRSTRYGDVESTISSSLSIECAHRIFESTEKLDRRYSSDNVRPLPLSDYLHPKYSLPPMKIDFDDAEQMYFKEYLRTPARLCVKKISLSKSIPESKSSQSASVAQYETIIV
uniref:Uncharacterized protein n=1 Tax=Elaeophora elaphi TaxID=1147741 RepID=A0A0R3RRZ5_9BILA